MSSLRAAVTPQKGPVPESTKSTRRQRGMAWFVIGLMLVSALGGLVYLVAGQ